MNEQQYIKGFNHGYLLSQHEPDLLNQLLQSSIKENDYFDGLTSGNKECVSEKSKQYLINKVPSHDKDDKGLEKGK